MRNLLCPDCGAAQKAKGMHPEDKAQGFQQRFVPIKKLKFPPEFGLTVNGVFQPSKAMVCDKCGKELVVGSQAVAWSVARGAMTFWEHDYGGYPPGVSEDEQGRLHINLPEMLQILGLPNTEKNRAFFAKEVKDILREIAPETKVEETP